MKSFVVLILAGFWSFCSFGQSKRNSFSIQGTIANSSSKTIELIYLNPRKKDSARIENGRFTFQGTASGPTRVLLRLPTAGIIDDTENYNITDLYVEAGNIVVSLVQDHFREVKVKGSKVQDEYVLLKQSFAGIDLKSPSAGDEFSRATAKFIRKHPDSYISIAELESYETRWPIDTVKALFKLISQKQKMSVPGQSVAAIIKGNDENTDGRVAKPIAAKNVKGQELALSDFAGKYVLLDFWGSWCVPCRESMPELKRLHQKYNSKGFEVLAIAHEYVQSDSLWKAAIEKDGTGIWHNIRDGRKFRTDKSIDDSESIVNAYSVQVFPTKFLIDRSGKIIRRFNGGDHEAELEALLEKIFKDQVN